MGGGSCDSFVSKFPLSSIVMVKRVLFQCGRLRGGDS